MSSVLVQLFLFLFFLSLPFSLLQLLFPLSCILNINFKNYYKIDVLYMNTFTWKNSRNTNGTQ